MVRSSTVSTTATRVTNKGDHEREGHRDHAHSNERAVAKPPGARRKPHTPTALRVAANRSPEYREPYAYESESDNRDAQQRHATGGGQRLIGRRVVDNTTLGSSFPPPFSPPPPSYRSSAGVSLSPPSTRSSQDAPDRIRSLRGAGLNDCP